MRLKCTTKVPKSPYILTPISTQNTYFTNLGGLGTGKHNLLEKKSKSIENFLKLHCMQPLDFARLFKMRFLVEVEKGQRRNQQPHRHLIEVKEPH